MKPIFLTGKVAFFQSNTIIFFFNFKNLASNGNTLYCAKNATKKKTFQTIEHSLSMSHNNYQQVTRMMFSFICSFFWHFQWDLHQLPLTQDTENMVDDSFITGIWINTRTRLTLCARWTQRIWRLKLNKCRDRRLSIWWSRSSWNARRTWPHLLLDRYWNQTSSKLTRWELVGISNYIYEWTSYAQRR